jgi:hypothetical protein
LNEQRECNPEKFPADFTFQLSPSETETFESQNVIQKSIMQGRRGEPPWAYTLEGCNMAATVLNTSKAVERAVKIIRTFSDLERMTPPTPNRVNFRLTLLNVYVII